MSSDTIQVGCPGCRSKLRLTQQHLGIEITCPKCQTVFRVSPKTEAGPSPVEPAAPELKPAPSAPKKVDYISSNQKRPKGLGRVHGSKPPTIQPAQPSELFQTPLLQEPKLAPPEPAQPKSYWQGANYSGAAAPEAAPQSRADRLRAAQQKNKQESEMGHGSDWMFRAGCFLVILALVGAGLPFAGLELKLGPPIVVMFLGLIGSGLLGFALRDNLVTAIGSGASAAMFVVVACLTSHYVLYVGEEALTDNNPAPAARSVAKKTNQPTRPASTRSNGVASAKQPAKTRLGNIIEQNKNRAAVAENPFQEVQAVTTPARDNSALANNANQLDDNPFSNFQEAPEIESRPPAQPDPGNPFQLDDDDGNSKVAESGNNSTFGGSDGDSNPFALPDELKNAINSAPPGVRDEINRAVAEMNKATENPFSIPDANSPPKDKPTKPDSDNPFVVDNSSTNEADVDDDNPFAIPNSGNDSGDSSNPFAMENNAESPGLLTKMTSSEEEKLFESRPNSAVRLQRGEPVDPSLLNGKELLAFVGKKETIGMAIHDDRPVIGLAWGKSFGRNMIMPVFQGDKQFSSEVRAEPGYFLAGINAGFAEKNINGVQAVFAKPGNGGQLDMTQTKSSAWLGKKTRKSLAEKTDSGGSMVYGIHLQLRADDVNGIGLVVD